MVSSVFRRASTLRSSADAASPLVVAFRPTIDSLGLDRGQNAVDGRERGFAALHALPPNLRTLGASGRLESVRFGAQSLNVLGERTLFGFEKPNLLDVGTEVRAGKTSPVVLTPLADLRRHGTTSSWNIDDQSRVPPHGEIDELFVHLSLDVDKSSGALFKHSFLLQPKAQIDVDHGHLRRGMAQLHLNEGNIMPKQGKFCSVEMTESMPAENKRLPSFVLDAVVAAPDTQCFPRGTMAQRLLRIPDPFAKKVFGFGTARILRAHLLLSDGFDHQGMGGVLLEERLGVPRFYLRLKEGQKHESVVIRVDGQAVIGKTM